MKEIIRFFLRVMATPVFVISFGLFWLGFMLFLGPMFWLFSFLTEEEFSWREWLEECNEFVLGPLMEIWGRRP